MSRERVHPSGAGWYAVYRDGADIQAYPILGWVTEWIDDWNEPDNRCGGSLVPIILKPDGDTESDHDWSYLAIIHRDHVPADVLEKWLSAWRTAVLARVERPDRGAA